MSDLISHTPTNPPKKRGRTAFGFVPAVELKHEEGRPGELVEVDENDNVVDRWDVRHNDRVCAKIGNKTIVIPKGYPKMKQKLEEAGARVKVHPDSTDAEELAKFAFGGVDYV